MPRCSGPSVPDPGLGDARDAHPDPPQRAPASCCSSAQSNRALIARGIVRDHWRRRPPHDARRATGPRGRLRPTPSVERSIVATRMQPASARRRTVRGARPPSERRGCPPRPGRVLSVSSRSATMARPERCRGLDLLASRIARRTSVRIAARLSLSGAERVATIRRSVHPAGEPLDLLFSVHPRPGFMMSSAIAPLPTLC